MKDQQPQADCVKLSARWTHPERETLVTGKLGFGSPTWASATTKPIRPEVGPFRNKTTPIRSMRNLHAMPVITGKPHDSTLIVMPEKAKDESVAKAMEKCAKSAKEVDQKVAIGNWYARLYSKLGNPRTKRKVKDYGCVADPI